MTWSDHGVVGNARDPPAASRSPSAWPARWNMGSVWPDIVSRPLGRALRFAFCFFLQGQPNLRCVIAAISRDDGQPRCRIVSLDIPPRQAPAVLVSYPSFHTQALPQAAPALSSPHCCLRPPLLLGGIPSLNAIESLIANDNKELCVRSSAAPFALSKPIRLMSLYQRVARPNTREPLFSSTSDTTWST